MATVHANSVTINSTSGTLQTGPFRANNKITSVDLSGVSWTYNSMRLAFGGCVYLTTVTNVNNNIVTMAGTFYGCSRLVNAPIIPNSVTNMYRTFYGCKNLTRDIYIKSNQIARADNCFYRDNPLIKNVYIPFIYKNGINTQTYNSFISAGYKIDGSLHNVYLRDIDTV